MEKGGIFAYWRPPQLGQVAVVVSISVWQYLHRTFTTCCVTTGAGCGGML